MTALSLLYVHSRSIGYGRLGVDLADTLRRRGITIFDHLPHPEDARSLDDAASSTGSLDGYVSGVANNVCWISTPTHATGWWSNQTPHIFTMWEAMTLPESFREGFDNFETMMVPSEQNLELFSRYHPNVNLVPLGIDPERWHYTPRQEAAEFRFLIGGSGPRKGTDLARKAFRAAFPHDKFVDGPKPVLIMKSPRGEEFLGSQDIQVISGRLTDEDEVGLYETAHCYLQPSRGEGFGLQPLQAMAQGIPTILTDAHGHAGFARLGHPLSSKPSKSAYFIYGDAGDWWEPDFDELVDYMRWVYLHYDLALEKAKVGAEVIAEKWTWDRTADKFLDVLAGSTGVMEEIEPATWVQPEYRKYLVITNCNHTCDIGGTMRHFEKGSQYWEPADVKRILFESEKLDPACLFMNGDESPENLGLADCQLNDIENYTAAQSWCPTCHQKLGTGVQRADVEYEAILEKVSW